VDQNILLTCLLLWAVLLHVYVPQYVAIVSRTRWSPLLSLVPAFDADSLTRSDVIHSAVCA